MATHTPLEVSRRKRPLLGLRSRPGRLALVVLRVPLHLYRRGRGRLLGRTFLLLVHRGRRTGVPHQTVAMVLGEDPTTGDVYICSGWGAGTDWMRNLRAGPALRVQLGPTSFRPAHRFLDEAEAFVVASAFRRRHPLRLRLAAAILGWGDMWDDDNLRRFIATHPFVALRPRTEAL
jgi:deazaflavin-dependent oxidoreductase (nitroreductase family)